jgi:hypothetical protein
MEDHVNVRQPQDNLNETNCERTKDMLHGKRLNILLLFHGTQRVTTHMSVGQTSEIVCDQHPIVLLGLTLEYNLASQRIGIDLLCVIECAQGL